MDFGILSVIPPLCTIALAIITKNVFLALMIGVVLGNLILDGGNILAALNDSLNGVINVFASSGNTITLASILLIGAIIYIIEKSGGITGFVDVMIKKRAIIKSKKGANFFTWLLGVLIFTSGSLSCMVVGSVSRPINDALKVPHEKAAFLVHSTSTPVCVLIPLSGWLAAMIGYLTSGGVAESEAMTVLVKSIPMNFYCMIAVIGCLVLSLMGKDFGPMKKAEERAAATGYLDDPKSNPYASTGDEDIELDTDKSRAINLILPLLGMILGVIVTLFVTGGGNILNGSGMQALLWGVFTALVVCGILTIGQKIYTFGQFIEQIFKGSSTMLSIAAILMFAFTLSPIVSTLGTGAYLSSIFEQFLTPALLPMLVFVMACLLSFSTGTSMGTMAIMSVIALPMATSLGMSVPLVASAVWGGSIFGDHASPVSDTTIMSCATTGCNIIDHVKTQIPYVAVFAALTIVYYLVAGFIA
jgi:tetracycline resistance efflux pump